MAAARPSEYTDRSETKKIWSPKGFTAHVLPVHQSLETLCLCDLPPAQRGAPAAHRP